MINLNDGTVTGDNGSKIDDKLGNTLAKEDNNNCIMGQSKQRIEEAKVDAEIKKIRAGNFNSLQDVTKQLNIVLKPLEEKIENLENKVDTLERKLSSHQYIHCL
jgi:predicted RNase H-like nuclease (RuvC/YqgF family)